jgi:hypothetical protein
MAAFKKNQVFKAPYDKGMGNTPLRHVGPGQGGKKTNLRLTDNSKAGAGAITRSVTPAKSKRYTAG